MTKQEREQLARWEDAFEHFVGEDCVKAINILWKGRFDVELDEKRRNRLKRAIDESLEDAFYACCEIAEEEEKS